MKLLFGTPIIAIAMACAGIAGPAFAQSDNDEAPVFRTGNTATVYQCEHGLRLEVTSMAIDDNYLISVQLPSSRAPKKSRVLLLPLSQSGSGVRYASDLSSFHLKGEQATFHSVESAISDRIERTSCRPER